MDYYDDDNRDNELVVQFENCRFHANRYFGKGAQTSLVMASSNQNRIFVNQTVFDNNDMTYNNTRGGGDEVSPLRFFLAAAMQIWKFERSITDDIGPVFVVHPLVPEIG